MSTKDINASTICPFYRSELGTRLNGEASRIPAEFQMRSLPTAKEEVSRETEVLAERNQKFFLREPASLYL